MPGSTYSRRSSSSSSTSSSRSTRSVESVEVHVPRKKCLKSLIWLAGGDSRSFKGVRREVTTTEYPDGTYDAMVQHYWVRNPSQPTYYFVEEGGYKEARAHRRSSGRSSRASGRSSHGPPPVPPMQPRAMPPQMPGPGPMHGGGGVPFMPGHGAPPMHPGGHFQPGPMPGAMPGAMPGGTFGVDDDAYSVMSGSSGSSYFSDSHEGGFSQGAGFSPMNMPPMNMPPMMHPAGGMAPPPPPPQLQGEGENTFFKIN